MTVPSIVVFRMCLSLGIDSLYCLCEVFELGAMGVQHDHTVRGKLVENFCRRPILGMPLHATSHATPHATPQVSTKCHNVCHDSAMMVPWLGHGGATMNVYATSPPSSSSS